MKKNTKIKNLKSPEPVERERERERATLYRQVGLKINLKRFIRQKKKKQEESREKRLKNAGITLIALVITVIVILILAGVSISMISGNNGILQQAGKASDAQKDAEEDEQVKMAVMTAIASDSLAKLKDANLREAITDTFGSADGLSGTGPWKYTGTRNKYVIDKYGNVNTSLSVNDNLESLKQIVSKTTAVEDVNGDIFYIPGGFKLADDSATNDDNGIVIEDAENNQFVWIPVPDVIYDSSRESELPKDTSNAAGLGEADVYTPMAIETSSGNYSGLLYNYDETALAYLRDPTSENFQWIYGREPDTVSDNDGNSTNLGHIIEILTDQTENYSSEAKFKETMQKDYNSMIASVEKYGGFYVGRYESSIDDTNTNKKTVRSTQGATSMTAEASSGNTWYGMYAREKNFSTNYVQGSMIWGSQYDAMMNWMLKDSINIASTTPISGSSKNTSRTTGTEEADKLNNVYDLLGNSLEWTLSANTTITRNYRGGDYDTRTKSPAEVASSNPYVHESVLSSRLTLYVK